MQASYGSSAAPASYINSATSSFYNAAASTYPYTTLNAAARGSLNPACKMSAAAAAGYIAATSYAASPAAAPFNSAVAAAVTGQQGAGQYSYGTTYSSPTPTASGFGAQGFSAQVSKSMIQVFLEWTKITYIQTMFRPGKIYRSFFSFVLYVFGDAELQVHYFPQRKLQYFWKVFSVSPKCDTIIHISR